MYDNNSHIDGRMTHIGRSAFSRGLNKCFLAVVELKMWKDEHTALYLWVCVDQAAVGFLNAVLTGDVHLNGQHVFTSIFSQVVDVFFLEARCYHLHSLFHKSLR